MTPRERSGPHAGPRPRASRRRRPGQKRRIAVDSPTPVKVRRARRPLVTFPILLGTLLPGQSGRPRGTPRADDAVLKGPLSRPLFSGRIIRMVLVYRHASIFRGRAVLVCGNRSLRGERARFSANSSRDINRHVSSISIFDRSFEGRRFPEASFSMFLPGRQACIQFLVPRITPRFGFLRT
jgi:hypothetical protein